MWHAAGALSGYLARAQFVRPSSRAEQGRAACILAHRGDVCSRTLADLAVELQVGSKQRRTEAAACDVQI